MSLYVLVYITFCLFTYLFMTLELLHHFRYCGSADINMGAQISLLDCAFIFLDILVHAEV